MAHLLRPWPSAHFLYTVQVTATYFPRLLTEIVTINKCYVNLCLVSRYNLLTYLFLAIDLAFS